MFRFLVRRLLLAIPTLLAIAALVFFASYLTPGDPAHAILGEKATPQAIETFNHKHGLDLPPLTRFFSYILGVLHGDFGTSYRYENQRVMDILARGFPNTALLAFYALLTSLGIGIPVGVVSAVYANKIPDRVSMGISMLGVAIPSFVLAPVLTLIFAVQYRLLPVSGFSIARNQIAPQYFVLPVLVLAARSSAMIARLTRSAMLDVLGQDYIRTAKAKGLVPFLVLFKHALKNAFPPILTIAGTTFGYLLSGSFVIETFFQIPGIGNLSIQSIRDRDYPVVQAMAILLAFVFVMVNLLVDILYGVFDPRVRAGQTEVEK
jgi:peptide/nickel transport system permease protein